MGLTFILAYLSTSIITAALITLIIGIAKEGYDKLRGGRFDLYDLLADILGILLALYIWNR
jgi:hypothetical protein